MTVTLLLLMTLMIAIVPVAMVMRSKRRRLSVRASGDPAQADPASTLRLGELVAAASKARRISSNVPSTRDPKPGSKDAAAASDPKSTLKLS
jgi:hypothetical protein